MRLRHLVLQGYKSFANKTEFEFPEGITAIVGPNGTGKSNIADAIRWALGERSMSTLRAKSTSDMIFAGGDGRARAGMAEVAMTFDNSDGGLPIEYSEVTIARRAFRSGDNEYLINGSKVLLRDIEELLAESSLSERTYTVIGQGVVDAALALRPEERRALFEEAAGITLYRDRREETVDRLDDAERNLERVRDIISEIAPRLERLERDARQVEQHRRLSGHLERLQRTWYGYRWGEQQAALERALERAEILEDKLEKRGQEASELGRRVSEVREEESALRRRLRDWYRKSGDLHDEVDKARRELAVCEERERLLKTRREELVEEIEPLQAQREEQAGRVGELRRRVDELERELADCQGRLAEVEAEAQDLARRAQMREEERREAEAELRVQRAQMDRLDSALREAREEISSLASERAVAKERARQLESRRAELAASLEPLNQEGEERAQEVGDHRARLRQLERRLADREGELADLEEAWEAFREEAATPDDERRRLTDELSDCRSEIERLEAAWQAARHVEAELAGESKVLERMHATGTACDKAVQTLLEADLDGVLGPLAGLIQVPPTWEQAVAAALGSELPGGALQAMVVEWESVVDEAHQILQERGGRLTLISLESTRGRAAAIVLPQHASSAASLVTCSDRVRPVVDALLGAVALCDDLSEARALQPKMPPGSCCVTRNGIVLRADGALVIGKAGTGGVLADERSRRELPKRLEKVRRRLRQLTTLRQEEERREATLEVRIDEIDSRAAKAREEKAHRFQERLAELRTTVAVTKQELRNRRSTLRHQESQLERLRAQRESLKVQAAELEEKYEEQTERAAALRLALDTPLATRSDLQQGDGELSGAEDDVSRVTEIAGGFLKRLRKASQECRELERKQRDTSKRMATLERRLERLTQESAQAREESARFERKELSEARTAVAVTEASLRSEKQTLDRELGLLDRLSSQVDARQERAEQLRAERSELVGRIAELRVATSTLEEELCTVRERIGPAEDDLERLENEQTSLEERQVRAQKRLRGAEERRGRAQLNVERRRDDLQLLAERIDEDLGLVELEIGASVTAQVPLPMRPFVSELPVVEELPEGLKDEMQFVKKRLQRLGAINPNAPAELAEVRERYEFLTEQEGDLRAATQQLRQTVNELDAMMERAFKETFDAVAERFADMFSHLFDGGEARLTLTDPEALLTTGVDIVARPPGKRAQRLALLSGGERALTAVALLFSLLQVSPTPFCVLDEVDAMLDEANIGRFRSKLEELSQSTQFIVISHSRGTLESADAVYGVSMGSNAVSQVVSLKLDDVRSRRRQA